MSQLRPIRISRCSSVSMPSATVRSPSRRAIATIDSTNVRAAGSVASLTTNSRSILSSENGVRTSFASDECPVPKSSIESSKPRMRKRARFSSAAPSLREAALSVISSTTSSGAAPAFTSARASDAPNSGSSSSVGQTFSDSVKSFPRGLICSRHCAERAATARVSERIMPLSWIIARKRSGGSGSVCSRHHRTSTSAPHTRPLRRSTLGWNHGSNSCCASASAT